MTGNIHKYLDSVISYFLIVVAALTPLVFLNLTTDFYDMPKLIMLVVAVVILYGLWITSWVVRGKITVTRTPLDVPLVVLLIAILTSAFLSTSRYASIFGIFPDVHGSAISWTAYILFYFVAVSNLKKEGQVKTLLHALFGSAVVVSLISFFSYFRLFLPFELAKGVNFTPAGTSFSAIALLLMLLPVSFMSMIVDNKFLPKPPAMVLSVLFSVVIIMIGSVPYYVILLAIFVICAFIVRDKLSGKTLLFLLIPFAAAVLVLVLITFPFFGNILYESRFNFPKEVQLPLGISWEISATAFRDAPLVGTGPATFLYNFTSYKPVEFNQLDLWNFTFSNAGNEILEVLGTWGLFGAFALIAACIAIILSSGKHIFSKRLDSTQGDMQVVLPGLAIGATVSVVLLFVHATTLVSVVVTLLLVAAFMASQKSIREKLTEFSVGIKIAASGNKQIDILPVMVLVLFLVAAVYTLNITYNVVLADYYHRLALSQANRDGTKTYEYLQKAESLNPYIDLYRIDMAQTNFALANALASQKGPTQDNPQGTLTDADKQTIQTLVAQAINEGRASVVLAPRSSRNWEVLALIYRNITGVAENSLTFALDSYGRAIQADPNNPALRVSVGSVYYTAQNYDLAIRFFSDSINLKPDYVNGYYNLAVALKDKGDLQNAQLVAEQAVALLRKDFSNEENNKASELLKQSWVKDYNTASELLNEIRGKINTDSGEQVDTALQNPNLPSIDVPNLNNLPGTNTPPTIEENPEANIPEIIPSATQTPTPGI